MKNWILKCIFSQLQSGMDLLWQEAGKEKGEGKQTEFSGFSEGRLIDSIGEESKGFSSDMYDDKDIAICDIK